MRLWGVVLTVVAATCACSGSDNIDTTPRIVEARQLRNDRRVALSLDACTEGHRAQAEVDEGPDSITITAHTDGSYIGDCSEGVTVELSEPVADRRVIDGSTGDTIEILPRP